jgi:hypothetical protein
MIELDSVTLTTNERAARVAERCGYRVVGFVMEHGEHPRRAIVKDAEVRWFPNDSDFTNMMGWRKHSAGPGVPEAGWPVDEMPQAAPVTVVAAAPAAPKRPVLTAPPTAKLLESTEEALGVLARDLGCVWNDAIPHNAGWFVPGKPTAYASAYDAIRGLHASLEGGGTVYRPAAPQPVERPQEWREFSNVVVVPPAQREFSNVAVVPPAPRAPKPVDIRQESLF